MPSRKQVIRLAELLASAPTVSYREHEVFVRIRAALESAGVPYASDRYGNLIAQTGPRRPRGRPVAFTAHADHPGLVITSCRGRTAEARWLGGVQKKYFRGASVRVETAAGPVRARITSARTAPNGRIAWLRLSSRAPGAAGFDRWLGSRAVPSRRVLDPYEVGRRPARMRRRALSPARDGGRSPALPHLRGVHAR